VESGDNLPVAGAANQEMNVCWTVAMPSLGPDHVSHGTVHRDHVSKRAHRTKIIAAVGIRAKTSAQIHLGRIVSLQIVVPRLVRLPDLDQRIGNSLSVGIDDFAIYANLGSTTLCNDGLAQFHHRRMLAVKRAEKTRLCTTLRGAPVVQGIHQRAETQS